VDIEIGWQRTCSTAVSMSLIAFILRHYEEIFCGKEAVSLWGFQTASFKARYKLA